MEQGYRAGGPLKTPARIAGYSPDVGSLSALMRFGRLVLPVAAVVLLAAPPVRAHVGGHELPVGTVLHVWTAPESHRPVPGTLLFVRDGQAHIEDVSGRIYAWPLAAMTVDDRARAEAFRRRVERINGMPPADADPIRMPAPQQIGRAHV